MAKEALLKKIFGIADISELDNSVIRARAIKFIYNKMADIIDIPDPGEIKLAQDILTEHYVTDFPPFPRAPEEMWAITQEYDLETATKLACNCTIYILSEFCKIDMAYPMIRSYLEFGVKVGVERAEDALAKYCYTISTLQTESVPAIGESTAHSDE